MKYAQNLRNQVVTAIKNGTFTFAEYFPDSKQAAQANKSDWPLFARVADQWLDSKRRQIAFTTFDAYRIAINDYFSREYVDKMTGCVAIPFNDRIMAEISISDIESLMNSLDVGNKTFNNILSILKNIYKYAVEREDTTGVKKDCASKIKRLATPEPEPDPLLPEEIELVLADMAKHYPEQIEIYFSLAFRIGFRPSEGIALKWGDIDWNRRELKISRARVRGKLKALKTEKTLQADEGKGRIVEIDDDCIALLTRLRKHTQMKGEWLFLNRSDEPYTSPACLVRNYWRPALMRCKIRDRDARQTRHTCATIMLMSGVRDVWAARQLGHSVEMFRHVYSEWSPPMDNRQQLAKFSAMFKKPEISKLAEKE